MLIFITKKKKNNNKIELSDKEKLIFACADGDFEEAKRLLSSGQDINTTDRYGHSLLWLACYRNQYEVVKLLLSYPNLNENKDELFRDMNGIFKSHNDATSYLLMKEKLDNPIFNPNEQDSDGKTILHLSAQNAHTETVRLLLSDPRIEVNIQDGQGCSSLFYACQKENNQGLVNLIASHKNLNWSSPLNYLAFPFACKNGYTLVVQKLIEDKNFDLNVKDSQGETPLHYAVYDGHTETVKLLLSDPRTDINTQNGQGETPLHYAVYGGHTETVKLVLSDPRTDINIQDSQGKTPLH